MRILVVDDDVTSQTVMMKTLCEFGECVAASSGEEAMAEFNHAYDIGSPFDLISLDISLPDASGIDVLKTIRAVEKARTVSRDRGSRVIMVSSFSDHNRVIGSVQAGCDHFIVKPFDRASLLEKISQICGLPLKIKKTI